MVRLLYARGYAMGAVWRHAGDGCVMSSTNVDVTEGLRANDGSEAVPDCSTFPGRYIAALEPSTTVGSTVAQVWAAMSSVRVKVAVSEEPVSRTFPSGSTNANG